MKSCRTTRRTGNSKEDGDPKLTVSGGRAEFARLQAGGAGTRHSFRNTEGIAAARQSTYAINGNSGRETLRAFGGTGGNRA